jgi:1-acyl-sn-glycerol-3-phosphate acyltransferase
VAERAYIHKKIGLLYRLMKILVRPAMFIFCRQTFVSNRAILQERGPLLIASNHPNSFLDAIIIDILFANPVWSLARGDVFRNKRIARILHSFQMLPVYRTSEGPGNISANYKTFDDCINIFRAGGVISIFSEGKCVNEWHLRPLKKGTARLATMCWQEGIPLKVLPVGINYSSFTRFGKNVWINFGDIITQDHIPTALSEGAQYQDFNNTLNSAFQQLVIEIPKEDKKRQRQLLFVPVSLFKRILLAIPAFIGWLFHAPLYLAVRQIARTKAAGTDHYDSVVVMMLFVLYPLYLVGIFIASCIWLGIGIAIYVMLLPICAWAYVQLKGQLDD